MIAASAASPIIALLGDINVDVLLDVPALPRLGGDALARGQQMMLGGSATNTAVLLSRLGNVARFAGRVGTDPLADLALRSLGREQVDLTHVGIDPVEPTSMNIVVITPDGERTMIAYRGANARFAPEHLDSTFVSGAAVLHLSGYALLAPSQRAAAWAAITQAEKLGVPITLDIPVAGAEYAREETLRLLPRLRLVVVGETEACLLTGLVDIDAAIGELIGLSDAAIALKQGPLGSRLIHAGSSTQVPALRVEALDTTGAGDAFAAGLIHALAHDLDDHAALVLANSLGALATTRIGAGTALPQCAEITAALRSGWSGNPALATAAQRAVASLSCVQNT